MQRGHQKHLLNVNPNQHLFERIPQLGLPSSLADYILYFISLNDGHDDSDDDDDQDKDDHDDDGSA